MSTFSGRFTGEGTPVKYWTGRRQTIQIKQLPQRHVERADPAADRRRERAFDAHKIFAKRLDRVVREPFVKFILRGLPCENFEPRNLFLPAVCFLDRGVEYADAGRPDIRAGPIASDEWNHRPVRHIQFSLRSRNLVARGRSNVFVRHKVGIVIADVAAANPISTATKSGAGALSPPLAAPSGGETASDSIA